MGYFKQFDLVTELLLSAIYALTFVLDVPPNVVANHGVLEAQFSSDIAHTLDGDGVLATIGAESLLDDATSGVKVEEPAL